MGRIAAHPWHQVMAMTPAQEKEYAEHLANREREHEAAIDRMRLGIVPYVSGDPRKTEPSTQHPCGFDGDAVVTTANEA